MKKNNRTLPRCNARIKPRKKYQLKNGLIRYVEVKGDPGSQRCTRSINCPHHKKRNAEVPMLPLDVPIYRNPEIIVERLTKEQVRAAINRGHMEVTGRPWKVG
jgi:hypothetical protein